MSRLARNEKQFLVVLVIPLLTVIVPTVALFLLGDKNAAWFDSFGGTILVFFFATVYIVFFDSKSRWPGLTAGERLTKVFTFQR